MKEVFYATTTGKKYQIYILENNGSYDMIEYTSGKPSGKSCNYSKEDMIVKIAEVITTAKHLDNINYKVIRNSLTSIHL